ncbi:MAG: aquaporin [Nocardioides sp.]
MACVAPRTSRLHGAARGRSRLSDRPTVVLTAVFLYVILGVTDTRAPKGFAPLAIGLALTLIHFISIPVTNTSVNPARSVGPALFAGGDAIAQLWLFILAPVIGALIAGFTYAFIGGSSKPVPLPRTTQP